MLGQKSCLNLVATKLAAVQRIASSHRDVCVFKLNDDFASVRLICAIWHGPWDNDLDAAAVLVRLIHHVLLDFVVLTVCHSHCVSSPRRRSWANAATATCTMNATDCVYKKQAMERALIMSECVLLPVLMTTRMISDTSYLCQPINGRFEAMGHPFGLSRPGSRHISTGSAKTTALPREFERWLQTI
jgi:hypothetical protein